MVKAHPFYSCGSGPGSPQIYGMQVYSLGMAVLAVFGLLYPIVTFLTVRRIAKQAAGAQGHDSRVWEELVEDEYQSDHWYFFHLHIVQTFALAASAANFGSNNELDSEVTSAWGPAIDAVVLLALLMAYAKRQPYLEGSEWKHSVQRLLLFTSLMLAVLGICSTKAADYAGAGRPNAALDGFVAVLAWVVLLLMTATLLKLCASFWAVVVVEHSIGAKSKSMLSRSGKLATVLFKSSAALREGIAKKASVFVGNRGQGALAQGDASAAAAAAAVAAAAAATGGWDMFPAEADAPQLAAGASASRGGGQPSHAKPQRLAMRTLHAKPARREVQLDGGSVRATDNPLHMQDPQPLWRAEPGGTGPEEHSWDVFPGRAVRESSHELRWNDANPLARAKDAGSETLRAEAAGPEEKQWHEVILSTSSAAR